MAGGLPHGEGRMVFASSDLYFGFFNRGVLDGDGTCRWANGDKYADRCKRGKKRDRGAFN